MSILQDLSTWESYQNIVLAYSVRTVAELAFLDKIHSLQEAFGGLVDNPAKLHFIRIVTREKLDNALHDRLPLLIKNGRLEKAVNLSLHPDSSHVMLCSNPQVVNDTKDALKEKGLTMNRRGVGNIAVENYW